MAFKVATVNSGSVPATQTNFPSYVDLARAGITTLAEANSVRVYADAGKVVQWSREIVSATEMWSRVPSLTNTTPIYLDWDGIRANYANTDPFGRNAVWTDYSAVYHMDDVTLDSSGNNQTLTNTNAVGTATGQLGLAADFSSNNTNKILIRNASVIPFNTLGTGFSMSAWWYSYNTLKSNPIFWNRSTNGSQLRQGGVEYNRPGNNYLADLFPNSGGGQTILSPAQAVSTAVWYKVTTSWTPNTLSLFHNGSSIGTLGHVWGAFSLNSAYLEIGARQGSLFGNSRIDEVRLRNSIVSTNWELTEFNNQNNESLFWGTWSNVSSGTIKTFNGVAIANVKTINGVPIANVKSWNSII